MSISDVKFRVVVIVESTCHRHIIEYIEVGRVRCHAEGDGFKCLCELHCAKVENLFSFYIVKHWNLRLCDYFCVYKHCLCLCARNALYYDGLEFVLSFFNSIKE